MSRYGMVIDLQKCTGCGACGIACKSENNTRDRNASQTFNWADFYRMTEGAYPNMKYTLLPVLCNHCTDAPCVDTCPVNPKAMFKADNGITLHNAERCIGCRMCQDACPYSDRDYSKDSVQYSVISYTGQDGDVFWNNNTEVIKNCTGSAKEVVDKTGQEPPYANLYNHSDYEPVRRDYITEKCILCDHRLKDSLEPFCVEICPSGSRVVGDFDDPNSEVSKLIEQYPYKTLKNNRGEFSNGAGGIRPNVYYIRDFNTNKK